MTRDQHLSAFDRIRVWQRGDRRAVHKPPLVLLALAAKIARRILEAHYPRRSAILCRRANPHPTHKIFDPGAFTA